MALTTTNAGGLVAGAKPAAAAAPAPVPVLLLRGAYVGGVAHTAGTVIDVPPDLALLLVSSNKATRNVPAKPPRAERAPRAPAPAEAPTPEN